MKDILISAIRIKKEFKVWLYCVGIAVLLNIVAIFMYKTGWIELLSQIHIELLISILIYFAAGVIRIIALLISRLFKATK